MPPLGTKVDPLKPKKLPACDRCKQKRVLCHPNPQLGCPRCLEQGHECTTTPVVRRKPSRKPRHSTTSTTREEGSRGSPSPTSSGSGTVTRSGSKTPDERSTTRGEFSQVDFGAFDNDGVGSGVHDMGGTLPQPPHHSSSPFPPPTSTTTTSSYPLSDSTYPLASTSTYVHPTTVPDPTVSSASMDFESFQIVAMNNYQPSVDVSPELAEHLFTCFAQSPQHEHPLLVSYSLARTLKLLNFNVNLLPSHSQVLAYCIFAIASLSSTHPSILDPYNFHSTSHRPIPSSEEVLRSLPDLRKYGKSRSWSFERYRSEAIRRAKESDVVFVASEDSTTVCYLLEFLDFGGNGRSSTPIWAVAAQSHLRILRSQIPIRENHQIRWAIYMFVDTIHAILNDEAPPTYQDQLNIVGPQIYTEADSLRMIKEEKARNYAGWPQATPHLMLGLDLARKIHQEFIAPWTNDQPFDFTSTCSILESLAHRRDCASHLVECSDRYVDQLGIAAPPQHFPRYSSTDHVSRIDLLPYTALRSLKMIIVITSAYLSLAFYNALSRKRNQVNGQDQLRQLEFCLDEARRLTWTGLEATLDAFDDMGFLLTWTHAIPNGFVKWAEFVIANVEEGKVIVNERIVSLVERLSSALKTTGFVWSNEQIDSLILSLDAHALAFRLATNTSQPRHQSSSSSSTFMPHFTQSTSSSSFDPSRAPSFDNAPTSRPQSTSLFATTTTDFDPTLSLFATLTSVSTPSPTDDQPVPSSQPSSTTTTSESSISIYDRMSELPQPTTTTDTDGDIPPAPPTPSRFLSSNISTSFSHGRMESGGGGGMGGGVRRTGMDDLSQALGLY